MPTTRGENPDDFPESDDPFTQLQHEARRRGMAFVDLERIRIHRPAFESIPVVLQTEYEAIPIRRDGDTLYVAMFRPDDAKCEALASFTGCRIVPVLALPEAMPDARRRAAENVD